MNNYKVLAIIVIVASILFLVVQQYSSHQDNLYRGNITFEKNDKVAPVNEKMYNSYDTQKRIETH